MAASERPRVPFVVTVALALATVTGSCAQATGLSDDYRYDLGAPAAPADASASDGGTDGSTDASLQCSASERARATTEIGNASGEFLTAACRQCLAAKCCAPIDGCASGNECQQSMRCIFNCQRENGGGNGKAQCLQNCRATFTQVVGTCIEMNCAAPTCQLL